MSETVISKAEEKEVRETYDHCMRTRGYSLNKLHIPSQDGSTARCYRRNQDVDFERREWECFPVGWVDICKACLKIHRNHE
jgi:hypothetical protein